MSLGFLFNVQLLAQTSTTYNSTGTWQAPSSCVTTITVECWGGGGAGGGETANTSLGGGGGAGGAYAKSIFTVSPGVSYNVTVGAGGNGTTGAGPSGSSSYFSTGATTLVLATGGAGGAAPNGGIVAGGTGSSVGCVGMTVTAGASGANGNATTGGAGGAAGGAGGSGGVAMGSGGGNGNPGTAPGGGGGGAFVNNNNNRNGGDGGTGRVIVTYANCVISTGIYPTTAQFVCLGNAATTLSTSVCSATATTVYSYQWYYNTTNSNTIAGATLIGGATSATYTPPSAATGTRYYFCVAYATTGGCAQTNATQSLASNVVQVTVNNTPPTVAAAGSNTTICNGGSANLAANTPVAGSGSWSVVSGPSLLLTQFSNVSSPNAVFTPAGGPVAYILRWTINNGGCTSTSDLTVTVNCGGACPACATYLHPTSGIANELVGSCETALCSGTYYDDGGSGGNYSNSMYNGFYRVFCPNTAGQCLTATFTSFNISTDIEIIGFSVYQDHLQVNNGSTQNSPNLFDGNGNAIPGPFTGTNNGCLSFRFFSNGSTRSSGWAVNFTCASCAGAPTGLTNADCKNATQLCSSASITGLTTGPGVTAEACGGGGCPAGGENHTSWYVVSINSPGTFMFDIVPVTGTDDFDYAVYGPAPNCNSLGAALRCSDSYLGGTTGLRASAADLTEDVNGNKFTAPINAVAGDVFYIMVDSWTPPTTGYSLNFTGTAGISCVPLPIELLSFDAIYDDRSAVVNLDWKTATESNNHYFEVQRSLNGIDFEKIDIVLGGGNTTDIRSYHSIDKHAVPEEMNYYRLKQVDYDGQFKYSKIVAVAFGSDKTQLNVLPNPNNGKADVNFVSNFDNTYTLTVFDITGKVVYENEIKAHVGKNVIPMDLINIPTGLHFVRVQGNGELYKTTFVKE